MNKKMILEIYQFVVDNIYYFLLFLWCLAILVYTAKLFIPFWDKFTRFGKNEIPNMQTKIMSIDNKIGWITFYSFSCIMFFGSFLIRYPPSLANYLLFFHSSRRLLESIFVTNFSSRRMHLVNLLAGLAFYVMVPLTLATSAKKQKYPFIFIIIAAVLNILQFTAHFQLSKLKKYTIPKGMLFRVCASPHYLIEILLYAVYLAAASSLLTFLMLFFVCFNLTHNSIMSYQWYQNKFGDEFNSLHRNVILPFIY